MVTNKTLSLSIVIFVAVLLSFMHCPLFEIFNEDKEIFRYAGMAIAKGQVPYRDFFDHKPPLIYFLNYWGYLTGLWGYWALDTLMVTVISVAFYRLCRRSHLALPWLLPCFFNLLLRSHLASNGMGMTREYTTMWMIAFFCVMLSERRSRFTWMGIISGLTFFMQQDAILILAPIALYGLLDKSDGVRTFIRRSLLMFGGFCMIAVPVIAYFMLHHALKDFWQCAFLTNFNVYTEHKPFADHMEFITGHLEENGYYLLFFSELVLVIILFYFNRKKGLLLAGIAVMLLCFANQFMSGRHITYYLLPLAAALPLLLYIILAYSPSIPEIARRVGYVFYVAIISGILINTQYRTHLATNAHVWVADTEQYQYLKEQHITDYNLFLFCSSRFLYINNQLRVLAPSKWIYHHFWYWFPDWDHDNHLLHDIEHDLLLHKTIYVMDFSDNEKFKKTNHYDDWKSFLNTYYVILMPYSEKSKSILWQRKPDVQVPQANR